jgi:non-specific serine/threonine protein kinase
MNAYDDPQPGEALTRRQREAAHLLAEGLTNREIGAAMGLSYKTVGVYVHAIIVKSGIHGRVRLARWCWTETR